MLIFDNVESAPDDPILGLNAAFLKDSRPTKVNLGVGAYKTAQGSPKVLSCVQKAEKILLEQNLDKEYQPIAGLPDFVQAASDLILGSQHPSLQQNRVFSLQTIGASGALRIGGELLHVRGSTEIYVSTPTWSNHYNLLRRAGLEIKTYAYYNADTHSISLDALLSDLSQLPERAPVLFHACCHNPTGSDLAEKEWQEISSVMKEKKLFPFFDFAYQGFGDGIEEDAWVIRHFAEQHPEMLVAYSFSKNLGLYGERVGLLLCLAKDPESAARVGSRLKSLVRGSYSTPPVHGARIVATVLQNPELRKAWEIELKEMRSRVNEMRRAFAEALAGKIKDRDFAFVNSQKGMFSYSGIGEKAVTRLREQYGIYFPSSGRISVAGLNQHNLEYVVEALAATLV